MNLAKTMVIYNDLINVQDREINNTDLELVEKYLPETIDTSIWFSTFGRNSYLSPECHYI